MRSVCAWVLVALFPLFLWADTSSVSVSVFTAQCNDGSDNDGDTLIDYPSDTGCTGFGDNNEGDVAVQCADTIDNDGDGFVDYPSDPGCDSSSDNSEVHIASGGGSGGIVGSGGVNPVSIRGDIREGSGVALSGFAYPTAAVRVLQDGRFVAETIASASGAFALEIPGVQQGTHIFSLIARDSTGRFSSAFSVPVSIQSGSHTALGGMVLPPTLTTNVREVRVGEEVRIEGEALPLAAVHIAVGPSPERVLTATSSARGTFSIGLSTDTLARGVYTVRARAYAQSARSAESAAVSFRVGERTVPRARGGFLRGDVNSDGRVNIIDFSIASYWYRRALTDVFAAIEVERLSGDQRVDMRDFSIIAYFWTG